MASPSRGSYTGRLTRYGELELPQGALAQLVRGLREAGETRLASRLARASEGDSIDLELKTDDYARILRALAQTPVPELRDFARVLEGRTEELATLRERRMAANEAFFRALNEKLEKLEQPATRSDTLVVVCECADEDCVKRLDLAHSEYTHVRSDPTWFVVAHEHADLEIEEVISRTDRFEVVRKLGVAADVAVHLDRTG